MGLLSEKKLIVLTLTTKNDIKDRSYTSVSFCSDEDTDF